MRGTPPVWASIPALLVGLAAGTAAELSAGLLLYSEEGFLPALTLILTVETAALGIGLWTRPLPLPGGEVEELRRGWLFALVAYALAAAFSGGLLLLDDGSRSGAGQGLGLALMGSLPLFAVGSLLGSMSRAEDSPSHVSRVGAPAVLGVALGFLATGVFLLPHVAPYTAFLLCMVALSGGALLHGLALDARPSVSIREVTLSPLGEVRVEDRVLGRPPRPVRVLREGGTIRGVEGEGGGPGRPWEEAVLAGIRGEARAPAAVLLLGGGGGTLSRHLRAAYPEMSIRVVERTRELVDVARRSFHPWTGWESIQLEVGDPLHLLGALPDGGASLLVVDVGVLPALGDLPCLGDGDWGELLRVCSSDGVVILGGLRSREGEEGDPGGLLRSRALSRFAWADLYRAEGSPEGPAFVPEVGVREDMLLLGREGSRRWSPALPGFRLIPDEG